MKTWPERKKAFMFEGRMAKIETVAAKTTIMVNAADLLMKSPSVY